MAVFLEKIRLFFNQFVAVMSTFSLPDLLDILIVAFLIYKLIRFVRETRAQQLLGGIVILVAVWILSGWLELTTMNWIMRNVFEQGLLAVAIIFQPEIRSALERVSRSNLSPLRRRNAGAQDVVRACIENVCRACKSFQSTKTGALIVFERKTGLGDIVKTGTTVDAEAASELIGNIFYPNTPLHDGAMIIRAGRICAAGCILPLTQNQELKKELGTRHRAALGMSENSDAVVVVVSEETGTISVAINGVLTRNYNNVTLASLLEEQLIEREGPAAANPLVRRFKELGGGRKKNGEN